MCPHCENIVGTVNIKDVNVVSGINQWRGIAYMCNHCRKILSVAIDPISLKSDIVDEIVQRLRG
jgi:hypothetical protein